MKCDEVRIMLSGYLDGEISPEEKEAIEGHLTSCEGCRGALAELESTVGHLRAIGEVEPPPWFTQRVMQRVREESGKKGFLQWLFFPLHVKLPVEALAVALVAVAAMYIFNTIRPEVQMKVSTESLAEAPAPEQKKEKALALRGDVKEAVPSGEGRQLQNEMDAADALSKSGQVGYREKKRAAPARLAEPEKAAKPEAASEPPPALTPSAEGEVMVDREMALKESYAAPEEERRDEERMFKISVSVRDVREARGAVEEAIKKAGGRIIEEETVEEGVVVAEVAPARLTGLIKELEAVGEVSAGAQALPGDYVVVRIELKEKR